MKGNSGVTVVGSGIIGLSIAYEFLLRDQEVTLVGPSELEGVASVAAGAMVDTFGEISTLDTVLERHQLEARLWAQDNYPDWVAGISESSGGEIFSRSGMFVVGNSGGDHDIEKLATMRREMARYEVAHDDIAPRDVPGLKPNTHFQAFDAMYLPTALTVDAADLVASLRKLIEQNDRCVWIKESVVAVTPATGEKRWTTTLDSGASIDSDELVIAAGAATKSVLGERLWAEAELPPLYFGRGASCVVSGGVPLEHAIRTPNRALACGIHLVPRAGGATYLGATNLFGTDHRRAGRGATVGELHTLLGAISAQLNTRLRNVCVEKVHWGLRPVTAHDHPIAGRTTIPGLSIVTGTHRTGVHLAPYLSKLVVAELLKTDDFVPVNNFAPAVTQNIAARKKDISLGMRSLLATALYPDGTMPYNRSQEVEVFMAELFRLATAKNADDQLRHQISELVENIDLDEQMMMRIFHEVLAARIPEEGPYVM